MVVSWGTSDGLLPAVLGVTEVTAGTIEVLTALE